MGYDVPNIILRPHRSAGAFVGVAIEKHQETSPPAAPVGPELSPSAFGTLRGAALQSLNAFIGALPNCSWGAWFDANANTQAEREDAWYLVRGFDPAAQ
jgi:hypothetical protein